MITITDLVPGKQYNLQFRSRLGIDVSPWSDLKTISVSDDVLAPAAVTGLTLSISGSSFRLRWNAITKNTDGTNVADFDDYVVRVSNGQTEALYYTRATTFDYSYDQNRAAFGSAQSTLTFSVVGRDRARNTIDFPAGVTGSNPAPDTPSNLVATGVGDGVSLRWDAPAETDLRGFGIYVNSTLVAETAGTSYIYTDKNYNINKTYQVTAVDSFGQSSPLSTAAFAASVQVGLDTVPPAAPTWSNPTHTHTVRYNGKTPIVEVSFNWNDNAENDLAGYILRYRPVGSSTYKEARSTVSAIMVDGLAINQNYEVGIAAFDKTNNRSAFTNLANLTFTDTTPPPKPAAPTAVSRMGNVVISWSGLTSTGGNQASDFSHADVYDVTSNRVWGRLVGAESLVVSGLAYNTNYTFRLHAYDIYGNRSVDSDPVTISVRSLVDTDIIGEILDGSNIINGTINATDKVLSNTIIARHMAANSISAGAMQANSVEADAIAAGAVRTEALAIGVLQEAGLGANKVNDSGFEDETYWNALVGGMVEGIVRPTSGIAPRSLASTSAKAGGRVLDLGLAGTGGDTGTVYITPTIDVPTSRRVYAGGWARTKGPVTGIGANSRVIMGVEWVLSNGTTANSVFTIGNTGSVFDWTYADEVYTAPTNAVAYRGLVGRRGMAAGQSLSYELDEIVVSDSVGTNPTGQNISITPSGIRLYDIEGTEVISLTSTPPNYININKAGVGGSAETVASISEDGNISGQTIDASDTLRWRGIDLISKDSYELNDNQARFPNQDLMWGVPWGIIGYAANGGNNGPTIDNTDGTGWFEMGVDLVRGRLYKVSMGQLRFGRGGGSGDFQVFATIVYTDTGAAPTIFSPAITYVSTPIFQSDDVGELWSPPAWGILRPRAGTTGTTLRHRFLLKYGMSRPTTAGTVSTFAFGDDGRSFKGLMTVEDIGPDRSNLIQINSGGGSQTGLGGATPPPPVPPPVTPPPRTITSRYGATWSGTYRNGSYHSGAGNEIKQGTLSGNTNFGLLGFDDVRIRSDLAGATIKSCTLYLYANHWYNNSGGTAIIGTTDHGGGRPSTLPLGFRSRVLSSSWPKPGGRVVNLTTQIGTEFKDGRAKSIILNDGRGGTQYYGSFNGVGMGNPPVLEIVYER